MYLKYAKMHFIIISYKVRKEVSLLRSFFHLSFRVHVPASNIWGAISP